MVYGVGFTHGVLHVAPQSFPIPHVCLRLRTGRMRYVVRGDNAAEQRRGLHPESRPVGKVKHAREHVCTYTRSCMHVYIYAYLVVSIYSDLSIYLSI